MLYTQGAFLEMALNGCKWIRLWMSVLGRWFNVVFFLFQLFMRNTLLLMNAVSSGGILQPTLRLNHAGKKNLEYLPAGS
jgi:hypothetical protein